MSSSRDELEATILQAQQDRRGLRKTQTALRRHTLPDPLAQAREEAALSAQILITSQSISRKRGLLKRIFSH